MEAAQSAASGGEDPDEVVCTVGEPASLPEGVAELSEEAALSLLLTRTSAVRAGPASFPEMVADAMAAHYSEVGCDAAIINGGFVRGDRAYGLGAALTLRDVRYELPFPKVAVLLRIRGDAIVQAIGEMLAPHPTPSGSYPHCSAALHVEFDSTLPVGCKTKVKRVTLRGAPLDLEREYLLSVTTFMASGGDGVAGFSRGTIVSQDQHKVADLVLKHMRSMRVIHPNLRPRVKAITTRNNRS
jgi:2',3'-cyclic-nucleotide 2'-phosphodiesterase (5'-nucleotidase family)